MGWAQILGNIIALVVWWSVFASIRFDYKADHALLFSAGVGLLSAFAWYALYEFVIARILKNKNIAAQK